MSPSPRVRIGIIILMHIRAYRRCRYKFMKYHCADDNVYTNTVTFLSKHFFFFFFHLSKIVFQFIINDVKITLYRSDIILLLRRNANALRLFCCLRRHVAFIFMLKYHINTLCYYLLYYFCSWTSTSNPLWHDHLFRSYYFP